MHAQPRGGDRDCQGGSPPLGRREFLTRTGLAGATLVALRGGPAAGAPAGGTYHVAPDGNDAHDGSASAPWRTLRYAARQAQPGDVVKVKAGVYRQTEIITRCHGTAERPIVFEADGGTVTIDGGRTVTGWRDEGEGRWSAAIGNDPALVVWVDGQQLLGPHYWHLSEVRPTAATLPRRTCVIEEGRLHLRLGDGGDPNEREVRVAVAHCLLLQNTRHTVWRGIGTAWGLNGYKLERESTYNLFTDAELCYHAQGVLETAEYREYGPSRANTFQRLHIHHVGLTKFEHGIYTDGVETRIQNCRFESISGAAIHAYPRPLRGVYDGNVMTDPARTWAPEHFRGDDPPDPTGHYTAIICWGRGEHRVTNNLIAGPFGDGINVRAPDCKLVNNTIVLERGPAIFLATSGNRVVNNILKTAGLYVVSEAAVDLDHNAFSGGRAWRIEGRSYSMAAELRDAGYERQGIEAAPQFRDAAAGDYRLAPGSPLRDAGTDVGAPDHDLAGNPRPQGSGIDLGAYEHPPGE